MSSLSFQGNATSYLRIPNANSINFGTGDFTIEWYQYQTDSNPYPRVFQIGSYDDENVSIGVSIEEGEGSSFYYWTNGTPNSVTTLESSDYKNKWVHFAICRSNNVTKVFMNGNSIYTMEDTNDFNSEEDLIITNESTQSDDAAFGGYIAYFTWVKGAALYTSDFTVSNTYPTLTSDYVLLLKASSYTGTLGSSVTSYNVSTIESLPTNFSSVHTTSSNTVNLRNMKSLFTDNSRVYYKPGSLASCGVGSVRNSSMKSRRI
jgi:hypothetical protein